MSICVHISFRLYSQSRRFNVFVSAGCSVSAVSCQSVSCMPVTAQSPVHAAFSESILILLPPCSLLLQFPVTHYMYGLSPLFFLIVDTYSKPLQKIGKHMGVLIGRSIPNKCNYCGMLSGFRTTGFIYFILLSPPAGRSPHILVHQLASPLDFPV